MTELELQKVIAEIEKIINRKLNEMKASNDAFIKELLHQTEVPEYMSVAEVRNYLNVSFPTIRNWRLEGRLKPIKVGHKNFYHRDNVREMFKCVKENKQ